MEAKLAELKNLLRESNDLEAAAALLTWDQTTYMPPGGASSRARHIATIKRLAHEKSTDPQIGHLLETLLPYAQQLPFDSDEASFIRVAHRDYQLAICRPSQFIAQLYSHTAACYDVWTRARPENDFAAVQPYLEKTLDLSRQMSEFFPGYAHVADPLISLTDYGMDVATIRTLFAELREQLVPLVHAIIERPLIDDSCLHQHFPEAAQWDFGADIIKRFGYDFTRGRQDSTPHPYAIAFSPNDVRITLRVDPYDISDGLFSALHEAGHAMYEQGVNADYEGTPLVGGTSSGVHESQSRLWENIVGRSLGFWQHYYPRLQATFAPQLGNVPLTTFYRAINRVVRSPIRTAADEVTYNLHVIIRFDLELAMLEGKLAVRDLPEAWRERYRSDLGIVVDDDRDGVLQDVHWFFDTIGGQFQGYTLGNILSAQFFDAAVHDHPRIPDEIANGEFTTLHRWLVEHIYRHGRKYTAPELIERVTGGPLRIEPYIRYLQTKFGALYEL